MLFVPSLEILISQLQAITHSLSSKINFITIFAGEELLHPWEPMIWTKSRETSAIKPEPQLTLNSLH
jgi:hypothetical protein